MSIGRFIQRKLERLLGRDVFAWTGKERLLPPARPRSAGVVRDVRGASDHLPVWAVALTAGAAASRLPSPRAAR
jgi:hypothetical protein